MDNLTSDLRLITAVVKCISDLEHIGDKAEKLLKFCIKN